MKIFKTYLYTNDNICKLGIFIYIYIYINNIVFSDNNVRWYLLSVKLRSYEDPCIMFSGFLTV